MDIDAILVRKPKLVLVDEDVAELLQAGTNVYTTLNIQHIKSLNDGVAQITGIVFWETVPDYIVEQADSVKLFGIPPDHHGFR